MEIQWFLIKLEILTFLPFWFRKQKSKKIRHYVFQLCIKRRSREPIVNELFNFDYLMNWSDIFNKLSEENKLSSENFQICLVSWRIRLTFSGEGRAGNYPVFGNSPIKLSIEYSFEKNWCILALKMEFFRKKSSKFLLNWEN